MSYCYMDDIYQEKFDPKRFVFDKVYDKRKMNDKPYVAPDAKSKKLYEDLKTVTSIQLNEKPDSFVVNCPKNFYELKYKDIILGSDYIGPSSSQAFKYFFTDEEIGKFIKKGRVLGGHILWPRFSNVKTINQGRGQIFKDRIDLTLLDLQNWYEGKRSVLKDSYEASKSWLKPHKDFTFEDFIKTFTLEDFYDFKTKYPYNIASFNKKTKSFDILFFPKVIKSKNEYKRFIEGNLYLISKRDKKIQEYLCKNNKDEIL